MVAYSAVETLLRRDRAIVLGALAGLTILSWAYILWLAAGMTMQAPTSDMPPMPGMAPPDAGGVLGPALTTWSLGDAVFMFVMWAVMMVGMMTPSAAPMILIYARVRRKAESVGKTFAPAGWFLAGYLLAWTGFSVLATAAQWGLERVALLTPMMAASTPVFGGLVLIAAGLYQWTSLKDTCLSQCQSPLVFIQRHGGFRRDAAGAVRLGLTHGAYCVGCCWALMALLFAGGIMNVLWIAGLAALVLAEKLIAIGRVLSRAVGAMLVLGGIWVLS